MSETYEVMNNEVNDNEVQVETEETNSKGFVSTALEGCGALALISGIGYAGYRVGKRVHRKLKERKAAKTQEEVVTVTKEELESETKKPKKDKSK